MTMTKYFLALGYFMFSLFSLQAQVTGRFVRVTGIAERSFKYESASVPITITEVLPNEKMQTQSKSIEQVRDEFISELVKIGLKASDLKEVASTDLNYPNKKVRNLKYKLTLPMDFEVGKLADILVEGVRKRPIQYSYVDGGTSLEDELATEAINDAKRKAEKLAKEVGKKIGKVLNIEDHSNGSCREIRESSSPTAKVMYRVHITFKLIG